MRALVLAAGVGQRLRPYTDNLPKPMLLAGDQPILAYNLAMLADAGFDEVVINLHYLPHTIRSYVGDGKRWKLRVTYSEEPVLLGTAGALRPFEAFFRTGTFAIVFGDNLAEIDLKTIVDQHRACDATATVAVWQRDDVTQSGVAEVDDVGRITRFVEKPAPGETDSRWVNAGYIVAEPALLDFIAPSGTSDLGRDVLPAILQSGLRVDAAFLRGGLWWFDRPEDYTASLRDPELLRFIASRHRDLAEQSAEE